MTTSHTHSKESHVKKHVGNGYSMKAGTVTGDLKSIKKGGVSLAHHLQDGTREIAKSAVTEAQHKLGDVQSFAGDHLISLEKEIVAKPVQSVAIAFAAGAVLSMLLGRR
jgi:ElaB/YqjD/DUF883 family membrane-anchored ribosome-binding protein